MLSPWSGPFEVVGTKGILVNIRDLRSKSERTEWVNHDRLSNSSVFRRRAKPDMRVDPAVDLTVEHNDPRIDNAHSPSESPDCCKSEDLTNNNHDVPNTRKLPLTVSELLTRSGRISRANRNLDFDYVVAIYC